MVEYRRVTGAFQRQEQEIKSLETMILNEIFAEVNATKSLELDMPKYIVADAYIGNEDTETGEKQLRFKYHACNSAVEVVESFFQRWPSGGRMVLKKNGEKYAFVSVDYIQKRAQFEQCVPLITSELARLGNPKYLICCVEANEQGYAVKHSRGFQKRDDAREFFEKAEVPEDGAIYTMSKVGKAYRPTDLRKPATNLARTAK